VLKLLKRRSQKNIKDRYSTYSRFSDAEKIDLQIRKFNSIWRTAQLHPFYRTLLEKYDLPSNITDISELEVFPQISKRMIQESKETICSGHRKFVSTGGSSGEPTVFPTNTSQISEEFESTYLGRYLSQIFVGDRTLLIWGHSHLYGKGLQKFKSILVQATKDTLSSRRRLNAYDLTLENIEEYYSAIQAYKPKVLIGYTSSIVLLAKYIASNHSFVVPKSLKAVIVTAENITNYDAAIIEETFCGLLIKEYGMAETSTIGYSSNTKPNYTTIYDSQLVYKNRDNQALVSCLYDRAFPLINYNTGDSLISDDRPFESILEFSGVEGRKIEIFPLLTEAGNFIDISGIMVIHVLKSLRDILYISPVYEEKRLSINLYTDPKSIGLHNSKDVMTLFCDAIDKEFSVKIIRANVCIQIYDKLERTISGKFKQGG